MKSVGLVARGGAVCGSGKAEKTLLILMDSRPAGIAAGSWPPGDAGRRLNPGRRAKIDIADRIDSYLRQLTRQIYKQKPFFIGVCHGMASAAKLIDTAPGLMTGAHGVMAVLAEAS